MCNGQTDFAPNSNYVARERKLWLPHFRTFCELVEGEENKLTTFSTWTIMLGCNESNITFQQHLCKLGQLWRSNRAVQVMSRYYVIYFPVAKNRRVYTLEFTWPWFALVVHITGTVRDVINQKLVHICDIIGETYRTS